MFVLVASRLVLAVFSKLALRIKVYRKKQYLCFVSN